MNSSIIKYSTRIVRRSCSSAHVSATSSILPTNQKEASQQCFSTITRGQDLLADSLAHGAKRKIVLDSYYPEIGIDVLGMIEYKQEILDENASTRSSNSSSSDNFGVNGIGRSQANASEDEERPQTLLMNSSIITFPNSCFLWNNVSKPKDVTLESLSIVQLLKPSIEFLFIGCDDPLPPRELNRIKKAMKEKSNIIVEQVDIMNAMGTFNVLNGEDRRVAVALVVDVKKEIEQ